MKTYIESLLRHALTALAGLGGFLASHNLIDAADRGAVDAAGGTVASGLVVIISAILCRMFISVVAKYFRTGSGELEHQGDGPTRVGLLFAFACAAAASGVVLPSCSGVAPVPAVSVAGPGYTAIYSSKSGLFVTADPRRLARQLAK